MRRFTSVVFDGEIVVVGNFWSKAEGEVLPVAHLVFVHRGNGFNNLNHTRENIFSQKQGYQTSSNLHSAPLRCANVPSLAWRTHTCGPHWCSRTLARCRSHL